MTEITDVDRVSADGIPIEIAGRTLRARFTNRSLLAMERKYGSLPKVGEVLRRVGGAEEDEEEVPLYATTFYFLGLALQHEDEITEDWLLDNADPKRILEYAEIAFQALIQAMPGVAVAANGENPTKPSKTAAAPKNNKSPGGASTGSLSRAAGSAAASSGTR